MSSPLEKYRSLLARGRIYDDPAQRRAVEELQLLWSRLQGYEADTSRKTLLGVFGWGRERLKESLVPGLYIYGGVGRGKSMLMDLFYETAPVAKKRRVHFHAFMQEIHAEIHKERQKHSADPVKPVAERISTEAVLLCFDEMQITDITDAMLVGRLFEALFAHRVVIVTTSNRHPDELYKEGLNRQLFLPFIAMIKEKLILHHLEAQRDFRTGRMSEDKRYFVPHGPEAMDALRLIWDDLTDHESSPLIVEVMGRKLEIARHSDGVVWVRFNDLCGGPLGAADYLALSKHVHTVILTEIPKLNRENANEAKRFVTLIDTLYEGKIRVFFSAETPPEEIYTEGPGAFEFERTISRLSEMMSSSWPNTGE